MSDECTRLLNPLNVFDNGIERSMLYRSLRKFPITIPGRCYIICFSFLIFYLIFTFYDLNWIWLIRSEDNVLTFCSLSHSRTFLSRLCNNFSLGLISGSLCIPLCSSNIFVQSCLGHGVKDNVILAVWENTQLILKSHQSQLESTIENLSSATSHLFAVKLVKQLLIERYFGTSQKVVFDISKYLVSIFDNYPRGILNQFEMKQILFFINEEENFKSYFLNNTGVAPYYFGNCGILWATAYMQDTNLLWALSNPLATAVPWKFRARIAIGFLNLIKNLEIVPFGPLHLCDVQLPNFGLQFIEGFPIIRAIDMDAALFQSYLVKFAIHNQNISCTKDSDCSVFNCHFKCGLKNNKCFPRIISNNLQNICKLIFQKHLLKNPPSVLYSRLNRILSRCLSDVHQDKIFFELYNLLWISSDFE